jgi:hypothetical protein
MSDYPEHDRQAAVTDASQAIGEFIDVGLPRLGMAIYEEVVVPCECHLCLRGRGDRSPFHSDDERATAIAGVVQARRWHPTQHSIASLLSKYFDIDQDRVEREKRAMLDHLRAASTR